jgi:hypothetical protein
MGVTRKNTRTNLESPTYEDAAEQRHKKKRSTNGTGNAR